MFSFRSHGWIGNEVHHSTQQSISKSGVQDEEYTKNNYTHRPVADRSSASWLGSITFLSASLGSKHCR